MTTVAVTAVAVVTAVATAAVVAAAGMADRSTGSTTVRSGRAIGAAGSAQPTASPTQDDPLVAALSEVAGGVRGRHAGGTAAGRGPWAVGAAGVLPGIAGATMVLAVLLRDHCRGTLWASPDQFTHACYSDIPALYGSAGLSSGVLPYLETSGGQHLAQPVGTGAGLWLLSVLAPQGREELRWAFDIAAVALTVALVALVLAVAALARRRPWDAAMVAASPVVATAGLVSLDLAAVTLAVLSVLALAHHRPVLAGVLLGVSVATRPMAVLVLLALLLLAARSGRWSGAAATAGATVLTWLAVNVPVAVLSLEGWSAYWSAVWAAPVGYGSLWLLPQLVSTGLGDQSTLPQAPGWLGLSGLALIVGVAALLAALPAPERRRWTPRNLYLVVPVVALVVVVPALAVRYGPAALQWLSGHQLSGSAGRWIALVGGCLVLVAVATFTLSVPRRPRLSVVVLLLVVGVLLVSPSIPVQASLWVLPFAVLAVPSWRDLLIWGSVEAMYATGTWLYLYGLSVDDRGLPAWLYALLTSARVGTLLWLAWRACELSRWPQDDPVRDPALGSDDPAAGELEDAPDVLVVPLPWSR